MAVDAAVSIDRYIQRVSLTAARVNEGPYDSCLYTNTQGVPALPVTLMSGGGTGYQRAEASAEAMRCLQCECLECVKVCEYLDHFGSYPKQYARQVYNNLSIVMGTRAANTLINSCSLCGLCGVICPTGMDMGELCRKARQTMVTQGHMPPSAHDFALPRHAVQQQRRGSLWPATSRAAQARVCLLPGVPAQRFRPPNRWNNFTVTYEKGYHRA